MSPLVGLVAPDNQMHYREGETRRCPHGPSDSSPVHKTPGATEHKSACPLRAHASGLERATLSRMTMQSTVAAVFLDGANHNS
jgi:hypothetical protein